MSMLRKFGLLFITTLLIFGSVAVIGWIGFQEHIRSLARSFSREQVAQETVAEDEAKAKALADHSTVESREEATAIVDTLEQRLSSLENDDLPEE